MASTDIHFDFGENWQEFSSHALSAARVSQARSEFQDLVAPLKLDGLSFLDIGFGQGLSLLAAAALGAKAVGCDINPKCARALEQNLKHFPELPAPPLAIVGSILDSSTIDSLQRATPGGYYDVVHSWGVLHHTGNMKRATANAAGLVGLGGHFIIALYNRHWSSSLWLAVKWTYVSSPRWVQRALVGAFYPVIYAAKWMVTLRSPGRQQRGMDFYYNVVDWVGGYPYEFASISETRDAVEAMGFTLERVIPAEVPTGCNQFVFKRCSGMRPAPQHPDCETAP